MTTCPTCNYPSEGACNNPACLGNPALSDESKARMQHLHDLRKAEEAERAMLRRARQSAMEGRRR